ncbi:MAG TPA: ATPase, partial [Micromonosporaceae bacterium]
ESAPPPVPEQLAAALDMTAELPKVVRRSPETAPPQPAAETRPRFLDETMELPIFRELESAWFRTRRSTPDDLAGKPPSPPAASRPASGPGAEQFARSDAGRGTGPASQETSTGGSAMVNKRSSGGWATEPSGVEASGSGPSALSEPVVHEWTTVADEGWRAASAAAEQEPADTTEVGLPKRVPMAQLVPGGVDKPTSSVERRTPESVRGLLSAYHRGVQRGRTHSKDDNPTSPGAPPTGPKTGLAPRADSGQKEQK